MPSFDVLDLKTPLFGAKLLEASAGTGKTFAIEHLFVRLLLEAPEGEDPLPLEQILAITFTRAAAREMRMRIRANLAKALLALKGLAPWSYLIPHVGSIQAERRLEAALTGFGKAQIFTIHGFCQRMLGEFALEARVLLTAREEIPFRKAVRPALLDFLETQQVLCPEQLGRLLAKKDPGELCDALINGSPPESGGDFTDDVTGVKEALSRCRCSRESMARDFERMQPNFKTTNYKVNEFDEQVEALEGLFTGDVSEALRRLLFFQASILKFLSPMNRKVKVKEDFRSPFFDWCIEELLPLFEQALEPKRLLRRLRFAWQEPFEKLLEERGLFSPDYLMQRLNRALDIPSFLAAVRKKYRAAIIDEFQDTDALQWDIFRRVFFENREKQRMFTLVGDPKQSIYRFRQADLYTYFNARKTLGVEAHYSLDTNYRSTPALIGALNDLFSDEQGEPWLWLPRENRKESYRPVQAGSKQTWDPGDGKGALQFFAVDNLGDEAFIYVAQEIIRLRPAVSSYGSFAVLVKDRTQAGACQSFFQSRGLPCWTKSQSPLGESLALCALEELFEALYFPRDSSKLKIFLAGPFIGRSVENLLDEAPYLPELFEWKGLLERKGLPAFFRAFFDARIGDRTVYERIAARGSSFFRDVFQIVEQLLQIRSPTFETVKRMFRELESADPEEEASARRRIENDEEAIHIMTMHASKGLEFDVVFVLGAATKTPRAEEEPDENEAEKLRQLYVALTRAKLRLYIPLVLQEKVREGSESPLELFWRRSKCGTNPIEIVDQFKIKNGHVGFDRDVLSQELDPPTPIVRKELVAPSVAPLPLAPARTIYSYTALTRPEEKAALPLLSLEGQTLHTLPRGSETGVIIHRIFERIFTEKSDPFEIVEQELKLSTLADWRHSIHDLVKRILHLPLFEGFSLLALNREDLRAEVEFLFTHSPHFLKGFVDLVFLWKGEMYFLDWKTNWLGMNEASYTEEALRTAMQEGDYWLQASLYAEALQRAWPAVSLGGAFYLFLRGIHGPQQGVLFFKPEPLQLEQRI